ncbi:MAG TPA: DUF2891 domain-containing protein [Allosphingosinicella sp.]
MTHELTLAAAERFAEAALGHVTREYPHKLDHVMDGPEDVRGPRDLHPIFFGSFDWHSCVHGYWLLMRLRRLFPQMAQARRIDALFEEMLTEDNVAGELAYLDRAYSGGFERPYGWAWLIALHREAQKRPDQPYADNLRPLARAFADRVLTYLPKLTYPIRVGAHYNTAFALILALGWADANDADLAALVRARASDYYSGDRDCPAWEPGGDEFLSAAMVEVLLMNRVLEAEAFREWLGQFLPRLAEGEPTTLFTPAFVSDRSDGKIAHLDGFNLTRAWCWRGIADRLEPALAERARATAEAHLEVSLPYVTGDYMGEHWLATFALLALEQPA